MTEFTRQTSLFVSVIFLALALNPLRALSQEVVVYEYIEASRDGTGKVYMGREISHVMGHLGAEWLERPQRDREEKTQRLVKELPLEAGDTMAA